MAPASLDKKRGQDNNDIWNIDVATNAIREDWFSRDEQGGRQQTDWSREPHLTEPKDHIPERAEREIRECDNRVLGSNRSKGGEHQPNKLGQRVRRRRQRKMVVGELPTPHLLSPNERVQRVVIDEADADP